MSVFETGIEYQHGRGSIKDAAINTIKGFMAVSAPTILPVELFKLSVNLKTASAGIAGYGTSFGDLAGALSQSLVARQTLAVLWAPVSLEGCLPSQALS